jgi:hypothetical protein
LSRIVPTAQLTVTFSGTASYFIEYIGAPGLA